MSSRSTASAWLCLCLERWSKLADSHGWISAFEQLPDADIRVLAFDAERQEIFIGIYGEFGWTNPDNYLEYIVTYWQDLPADPGTETLAAVMKDACS